LVFLGGGGGGPGKFGGRGLCEIQEGPPTAVRGQGFYWGSKGLSNSFQFLLFIPYYFPGFVGV